MIKVEVDALSKIKFSNLVGSNPNISNELQW